MNERAGGVGTFGREQYYYASRNLYITIMRASTVGRGGNGNGRALLIL